MELHCRAVVYFWILQWHDAIGKQSVTGSEVTLLTVKQFANSYAYIFLLIKERHCIL